MLQNASEYLRMLQNASECPEMLHDGRQGALINRVNRWSHVTQAPPPPPPIRDPGSTGRGISACFNFWLIDAWARLR